MNTREYMTYKLGFSKHPSRETHFTLESLYNTKTVYKVSRITDFAKVYLNFSDNETDYHLVSENNEFLFKVGEKQDLVLRKFDTEEGNLLNSLQEKVKYVYIRHDQDNNFLVPEFINKFNQYKLLYIKLNHLSETSSLKYDLVWKCIVHEDQKVTFVHCKTGIVLAFEDNHPVPIPSTHDIDYQDLVTKIHRGDFAFGIQPLRHNQSFHKTLLREEDFYLAKEINGKTVIVDYYCDKSIDTSDPNKRPGEARFNTAPLLKDQPFIDEDTFDLVGSDIIRFRLAPDSVKTEGAIFSIVKLGETWKEEIQIAQSISAILKAHYYMHINPYNKKENETYNCEYFKKNLMYKENIKAFTLLHDYLTNVPPDQISPYFTTGKVVKLRSNLL